MDIIITIADEFTVSMPYDAGVVTIESAKMPADIFVRAAIHGLTQKIGDLSSRKDISKTSPASAVREACEKVRDAWYAGSWSTGRETDPIMSRVKRIATARVVKMYEDKHGKKWADVEAHKVAFPGKVTAYMALKAAELREEAVRQLDAESAPDDFEI